MKKYSLKMNNFIIMTLLSSFSLFIISAFFAISDAGEIQKGGLTGSIFLGGAYATGDLSLDDADADGNSIITSLDQSSKTQSEFLPVISGSLDYYFIESGTILSLSAGSGITASVSQDLKNSGKLILDIGYSESDVWEDPFITGRKRKTTDSITKEVSLAWEDIMNTGFVMGYSFSRIDIDNDTAGKRDKRLKRDGNIHAFNIGHGLYENDIHEVYADINYGYGDLSGSSFSYREFGASLSHVLDMGGWNIETSISMEKCDYDKTHPEFNKTRDDMQYAIESVYTLNNPLGFKNFFISVFASYSVIDSNINFYDSSSFVSGAGVGYLF
jgi:hypothetical protein